MSNQLEKLKNSINKEYSKIFEINLMQTSGFIPVDMRHEDFYIIINKTSLDNKTKIEQILKEKYANCTPKFIPVESQDFEEIFKHLYAEAKTEEVLTAEQMLVSIGWISQSQLNQCEKEAREMSLPLDAIFKRNDILSYERIV